MKRLRSLAPIVTAALAACVPASEEQPPAGAAGFVTEPSPATRGEPFVTSDGWTLRFEKIALATHVIALVRSPTGSGSYGNSGGWLWDASRAVELYVPAVPVGPASVDFALRGNLIPSNRAADGRRHVGIPPELAQRFLRPAEQGLADGFGDFGFGPSVIVILRAERGGQVKRMDVGLTTTSSQSSSSSFEPNVEVREDQLAVRPLVVRVEQLFTEASGSVTFDRFAAADDDGDANGTISTAELLAVRVPSDGIDLLALMTKRSQGMLVPR